jgi:hypothetical protein
MPINSMPSELRALTSAPRCIKRSMVSVCPLRAATVRGVAPCCLAATPATGYALQSSSPLVVLGSLLCPNTPTAQAKWRCRAPRCCDRRTAARHWVSRVMTLALHRGFYPVQSI